MERDTKKTPIVAGQADDIDRGTGQAASGGGLDSSASQPAPPPNGDADEDGGKVDDELQRPPEDRSPLT